MPRPSSSPSVFRRVWTWALPSLWLLTGCGPGRETAEPPPKNVFFSIRWKLEDAASGVHVLCEPGERVRLVGEGLSETLDCTDDTRGDRSINGTLRTSARAGEHEARLELLDAAGGVLASNPLRFTLSADGPPHHGLELQRLVIPSMSGSTGRLMLTWQKRSPSGDLICSCAGRQYLEVEVVGQEVLAIDCGTFEGTHLFYESGAQGKELSLPSGPRQLNVRLKENHTWSTEAEVTGLSVTLVPGRRVYQHVTFVKCP